MRKKLNELDISVLELEREELSKHVVTNLKRDGEYWDLYMLAIEGITAELERRRLERLLKFLILKKKR